MRLPLWVTSVNVLLALALGFLLWHISDRSPVIREVERRFQDALISAQQRPRQLPVPVTLISMEDAENWTALEYSLFLKALPKEHPPIVILESLPAPGNTAFDRAFKDLAIRQPRLVLPVRLGWGKEDTEDDIWWLKGWNADPADNSLTPYGSVSESPPEVLRGTVEVGVANLANHEDRATIYFRIGQRNVPSQALRAALLARKISVETIHTDNGLLLDDQRLATDDDASIPVQLGLLPNIRRIDSSDLLLTLAGEMPPRTKKINADQLQGVLVLGNLAPSARTIHPHAGVSLTPAEWTAATVATICNGAPLTPVGAGARGLIFAGCVLTPLLFLRRPGVDRWFGFIVTLGFYLLAGTWLAGGYSLALPIFLPFFVLLFGTALHHLALLLSQRYE
ncbi:MAG: hypothetical protein ABIT76_06160 [Chthoniobacterales bacterium]